MVSVLVHLIENCVKNYKIPTVTAPYILKVTHCIRKYKFALEQNVYVHDYNTRKTWIYMFCHVTRISLKKSVINMGI